MLEAPSQRQPTQPDSQLDTFEQARWMNRFSRKKKQPMHPSKRFNHGSVAYEGHLYIIGGANTNTDKPIDTFSVYRLDIQNGDWELLPDEQGQKPEPISAFTCCLYGSTILLFGGTDMSNRQNNNLWQFTIADNTWKKLAQSGQVPSPRESSTGVVVDQAMFLYGGISFGISKIFSEMYALNLTNLRWSVVTFTGDTIPPRTLQGGCAVDGRIYIFGGQYVQYNEICYDDLFEMVLTGSVVAVKQIPTATRPPGRHSHALTPLANHYLVLIGGEGYAGEHQEQEKGQDEPTIAFNDVWLFDRVKLNWLKVEPRNPIFKPRSNFSCSEYEGRLLIFGGLRNNNHLYDQMLTLQLDLDKLATSNTNKLCNRCHQLTAVQELLPVNEELQMSFHFLQSTVNLIKFPFAAFGLLIDNCVATSATLINISVLDREDQSETKIIRQEGKGPGVMDAMKNPERTVQYILIEDNGRPWANEQFLRVVLKFETVNFFEYQVADKKARAALLRENIKRQFGINLKMGCLRLGKGFVYISYLNSCVRAAMLVPKNRPGEEYVYVCYHYIEDLSTKTFLTAQGAQNKAHMLSVCRSILKPTALTEIHDKNALYIFQLRETQTKQGTFYQLNSYRNDYVYGNLLKMEFLQKVGYNIFDCPDFSLRAYISLLYLKMQTKIFLQTDRQVSEEIVNQMFLDKIDRQKIAGFVKEIDYANQYTELAECKVVELYYNPNLDRRSNLFHSGVLIYHRNRLIFRYKYELGQLFPLKFFRRKYKRTQNNVFQFFGFIELPDGVPYNFIKTEMQHHILMEGFLASLKLILKDIKRKLSRDGMEMAQGAPKASLVLGEQGYQIAKKQQAVQRPGALPVETKSPTKEPQKKKEPLIIHLERPEDDISELQPLPYIKDDDEKEQKPKQKEAELEEKQRPERPSTMPPEDQNVPIMHIESESESHSGDDDEDQDDVSSHSQRSGDDEDYNGPDQELEEGVGNTEEKQQSGERLHQSAEAQVVFPREQESQRNCQSEMIAEEEQPPSNEGQPAENAQNAQNDRAMEEEEEIQQDQPFDEKADEASKIEIEEPQAPMANIDPTAVEEEEADVPVPAEVLMPVPVPVPILEPHEPDQEPGQIFDMPEEVAGDELRILKEIIAKRNGLQ